MSFFLVTQRGLYPRAKKRAPGTFFALCGAPPFSSPMAHAKRKAPHTGRFPFGDPAGTRTPDLRLKRALLYQLSYWVASLQTGCSSRFDVAGMAGLEPANAGVKVPCLTTWLHPNITVLKSEGPERTLRPFRLEDIWGG